MTTVTYWNKLMSASDDDPFIKRAVDALLNGAGQKLAQAIVIIAWPAVTGLAFYAWNLNVENQNLKLNAISQKLDESLLQGHDLDLRVNSLERGTARIEERQAAQDARLTALERKR